MIKVTKLDGSVYYLNPQQIEFIETNPDTTICFVSGQRVIVTEDIDTVKARIVAYQAEIAVVATQVQQAAGGSRV